MKTTGSTTAALPAPGGFRAALQAELQRRRAVNRRYSLRAFALHLGIDHSTLSQILRGKRPVTSRTVERLGTRLGLGRDAVAVFVVEEARRAAAPDAAAREVRRLAADTAELLSDWYHWAILELVRLHDFVPDSRWIAGVLGISVDAVNLALSRLLHLRLLEMSAADRWTDLSGDTTSTYDDFTRAAVQRLWQQVNDLAAAALHSVPPALREHGATTLAVRTACLPEALARIAAFRHDMVAWLESQANPDDVYRLEIGFFPVTRLHHTLEDGDEPSGDPVPDSGEKS